jgi:hypothetical protein
MTPCSVVLGYRCFESLSCFHPEDGGSMDLRNVGILQQHFTALQHRRPRREKSKNVRCAGLVPRMQEVRNAREILVEKLGG